MTVLLNPHRKSNRNVLGVFDAKRLLKLFCICCRGIFKNTQECSEPFDSRCFCLLETVAGSPWERNNCPLQIQSNFYNRLLFSNKHQIHSVRFDDTFMWEFGEQFGLPGIWSISWDLALQSDNFVNLLQAQAWRILPQQSLGISHWIWKKRVVGISRSEIHQGTKASFKTLTNR